MLEEYIHLPFSWFLKITDEKLLKILPAGFIQNFIFKEKWALLFKRGRMWQQHQSFASEHIHYPAKTSVSVLYPFENDGLKHLSKKISLPSKSGFNRKRRKALESISLRCNLLLELPLILLPRLNYFRLRCCK